MKHLPIGGSSFLRTLGCAGWLEASKDIKPRPAGAAAVNGSMHHEVQEVCQHEDKRPEDLIGLVYKEGKETLTFTENDLPLANKAFDATNKILDELMVDEFIIEPFVQFIKGEAGGSIDLLGLSEDGKTIIVLDYKFGRVKVDVENNAQLLFYLVCARHDKKTADMFKNVKKIELVIIQPQHGVGVYRWSSSIAELDAFEIKMTEAIEKTKLKIPPKHPGKHCKYCPAEPYCKEKRADVVGAIGLGARSKDELQACADKVEQVEDWLNSVKQELYIQMNRGVAVKGWKIVDKQASLKWTDADAGRMALKKADVKCSIYEVTNMRTAPQVRDALKKEKIDFDLSDYTETKSSGTTIAPDHDDRDAVKVDTTPANLKNLGKGTTKKAKERKKKDG
jgi:CRISPR/Cas system-associated exonuclease Cas4 (RecB family)